MELLLIAALSGIELLIKERFACSVVVVFNIFMGVMIQMLMSGFDFYHMTEGIILGLAMSGIYFYGNELKYK